MILNLDQQIKKKLTSADARRKENMDLRRSQMISAQKIKMDK